MNGYLWVKALHIVFITSWFAGLFYLPRIFVNLASLPADATGPGPDAERARLLGMARRLYRFMLPLAIIASIFGLTLFGVYGIGMGPGSGWMHAKWLIIVLLYGYHHACGRLLHKFEAGTQRHSETWFRWFNEVPVILLLIAVILVVVKPF